MGLTKRNDQDFVGTTIADITASSDSLKSLSSGATNYALEGIDAATGNSYKAFNGDVRQDKNCLTLYFDVATDGGAQGTINLRGGTLPDNAIIDRAWYEVTTTFTDGASDSATIALGVATNDATGIVSATAISAMGDIWDAGVHAGIDPSTAADFTTKTTAERNIIATVGTADLTAGALVLHVEFKVSEAQ